MQIIEKSVKVQTQNKETTGCGFMNINVCETKVTYIMCTYTDNTEPVPVYVKCWLNLCPAPVEHIAQFMDGW
jgi:hypothetical protein